MAIGRVPGATGIQPSIVDAKGDLIAATAADSVSRLAAGSNNQVLTADSAEATGLKYANGSRATLTTTGDILYASAANTPARLGIGSTGNVLTVSGGVPAWAAPAGANWSLVNAGGTALTGASTITISGISNADKIMMLVVDGSSASASSTFHCRLNADTGANYNFVGHYHPISTTYDGGDISGIGLLGEVWIRLAKMSTSAASVINAAITFTGCNASGVKAYAATAGNSGGANGATYITQGFWSGSAAVTSISVVSGTGNFDAGTVYVYTSA